MKWAAIYFMESEGVFRRLAAFTLERWTQQEIEDLLDFVNTRHDPDLAASTFFMANAAKWEEENLYPHPDGTLRQREPDRTRGLTAALLAYKPGGAL